MLLLIFSLKALASTQNEIRHLLSFVASTSCKYERNGAMHNATEAVSHINRRYEYLLAAIKSTEDFIQYSMRKSTLSGKYYRIHYGREPTLRSEDWYWMNLSVIES